MLFATQWVFKRARESAGKRRLQEDSRPKAFWWGIQRILGMDNTCRLVQHVHIAGVSGTRFIQLMPDNHIDWNAAKESLIDRLSRCSCYRSNNYSMQKIFHKTWYFTWVGLSYCNVICAQRISTRKEMEQTKNQTSLVSFFSAFSRGNV